MKDKNQLTLFYKDLDDDLSIDEIFIKSYTSNEKYKFNEEDYYKKIKHIINDLSLYDKKIKLQIDVINRELFKTIIDVKNIPSNIELTLRVTLHPEYNLSIGIETKNYLYSIEEYIQEENILNNLVKDIKYGNLSQFEKYIYVYNIVKNFKPYQENEEQLGDSRCLKCILKNDYMVCVGFSVLLKTLLDKVNIPCVDLSTYFYLPIDDKNDNLELVGHQRNLIKIDDDKYNIHGIYVSDPTFDHNMEKDLYNNCILTLSQRVKKDGLIKENEIVPLLHFDDEKDFYSKTNVDVLAKAWGLSNSQVHLKFIKSILNILIDLDSKQYKYFSETYLDVMSNYSQFELLVKFENTSTSETEKLKKEMEDKIEQFYKEYCNYVLLTTNNEIDINIIEQIKNSKNIDIK